MLLSNRAMMIRSTYTLVYCRKLPPEYRIDINTDAACAAKFRFPPKKYSESMPLPKTILVPVTGHYVVTVQQSYCSYIPPDPSGHSRAPC